MSERVSYGASSHYLGAEGERYFEWQQQSAKLLARLYARHFEQYIQPSHTVLDFGCGGGFVLGALDCTRRIGVEINPVARARAIQQGVECFSDLGGVADASVDVAISHHALEHVPFPIRALAQIRRKLRESGRLVLCLPVENWGRTRRYRADNVDHHLHAWTPQLLGNTLWEAGFQVSSGDIRSVTYRPTRWHAKLMDSCPSSLFDATCVLWAMIQRHRELVAVVSPDWTREPEFALD